MRHKLGLWAGIALLCAMAFSTPSLAQNVNNQALVVTTCGTQTWTTGGWSAITQTATGSLCTNSSGGGGSTAITSPLGPSTAPAAAVATVPSATATGQVAVSVAPVTATNTATVVDLRPDSPGIIALGSAAITGAVPVIASSQYPTNATTTSPQPVTATATGTTAATAATIPAVASKTAFICGFTITSDATALVVGTAVVSGTISGSLSYLQTVQAVASGSSTLTQSFNPCVPASGANTAIVVTSPAAGTGGNTIVNAQGYYL